MGKLRFRGVWQLACTALGLESVGAADPTSSPLSVPVRFFIFRKLWVSGRAGPRAGAGAQRFPKWEMRTQPPAPSRFLYEH